MLENVDKKLLIYKYDEARDSDDSGKEYDFRNGVIEVIKKYYDRFSPDKLEDIENTEEFKNVMGFIGDELIQHYIDVRKATSELRDQIKEEGLISRLIELFKSMVLHSGRVHDEAEKHLVLHDENAPESSFTEKLKKDREKELEKELSK